MNREIKFRGKRVDNGDWVIGDLIQLSDGRKFIVDNHFGACIDDKGNFINTESPFVNKVIPETVGLYIGVNGKNNIELYEDDIVKAWSQGQCATFVIKWRQGGTPCFILYPAWQGGQFWGISASKNNDGEYLDSLERIGNVFDNPELLEDSK